MRDYANLIRLLVESGNGLDALNVLTQMLCKGGKLSRVSELMTNMEMKGIGLNLLTYKIMINGLLSKGEIIKAFCLLNKVLDNCSCLRILNVEEIRLKLYLS
ncbi:PPR domain-containing protein [Cephalotus follicularis]|uniref:PPR domain-containing protein n=1 Tax=Cephalotus follicularis TaxID=3775 RepID=A0A1Q3D593_CEPFO|nr:PPR domain-containing protein [Cephalotus follicularis]